MMSNDNPDINPDTMSEDFNAPVRLCCGQQHYGPSCNDGKVMCQLCFGRFDIADLNVTADGTPEDVCKKCHEEEKQHPNYRGPK